MSSDYRKAIKSIRAHIGAQEYEAALYEATETLKQLKDKDEEASQILVFRGLALTNLERRDEAEKCYLHAFRLKPDSALATVGLRKLYEKQEQWDKLGRFLETLVQAAYDEGDGDRCAAVLQDLVDLRLNHGTEDELYQTIQLLLPSSPLVPVLQPIPAPAGSFIPFSTPQYPPRNLIDLPQLPKPLPHILHLLSSLPLLLTLLMRCEVQVNQTLEVQVKAARSRLNAGPEREVRKRVEGEILGGSLGMKMVDLLREVGSHPGVEDTVRREVDVKEFVFWRKLVGCLASETDKPATGKGKPKAKLPTEDTSADDLPLPTLFKTATYPTPTKAEALHRADGLANGFVLLGIGGIEAEEGWSWVLEGKDEPTLFYDLDLLHKYAQTFSASPMTDFIDDYCRWFKRPPPEPEEEEQLAITASDANGDTESKPVKPKKARYRRNKAGMNAKERRKARRGAVKEGTLAEDVDQEERDELVASMTKLLDKLPKSIFAHRVMARISIQEEDWANAVAFADKGRVLVEDLEAERGINFPNAQSSLDTALGVALVPYYSPKHHPRATRLLNSVLSAEPANAEARFARGQIFQAAGNWVEARKHFEKLLDTGGSDKDMVSAKEEVAWCLVNEGKLAEGRDLLEEVVEVRDTRWAEEQKDDEALPRARAWWMLGSTEWMIGDEESRGHAEEWFMASIHALPSFAPAYTALGICYSAASPPDNDRALKCYQKAFELDATEAEAAHRLAIGYANDDEWAQVRAIATRVMQGEGGVEGVAGGEVMNAKGRFAPKNGWAWKALGSTEMHYKNYAKAGQAYQIALRADQEDVSTWLMLGESYVKMGRHMAGLKTLGKALELDPTSWMALYHIGVVHAQLGSFDLAIESYEKIAKMTEGKEVGIIAALAGAMLNLGRQTGAAGFRERSRRAFHNAIKLAGQVLDANVGHRPWAWKVIGDATFELSNQESNLDEVNSSAEIIQPILALLEIDDTDRRSTIEGLGHAANLLQAPVDLNHTLKASIFAFAYRAYLLKNETRVADPAVYDLASALHALALRLEEGEVKMACTKRAIAAIRLALERDAGDERLWNALGVICAGAGKEVAQHAFVVSLELYAKDPVVWTNLGYLYFDLDDRELAKACFLKAQIIDPDYARAWLGQGLLAEKNQEMDHAKALFAHSVTLSAGSLLEADLALAAATFQPYLSAKSSIDISQLHEPVFALRHYTHQRFNDSTAAHLYALICERLGLVSESADALQRATTLLEEEFEKTESTDVESRYLLALCNLGRVQLANKAYMSALEAYNNLWELIVNSPEETAARWRVQCRLGQGLAHFWLEEVDESLDGFQAALDEAKEEGMKEVVAVLLCRTLWGLGGDDAREVAKGHLMECLSHAKPSIKVISTLSAIATITSDPELLDAAISELRSIPSERRLVEDPLGQSTFVLYAHALTSANANKMEAQTILEEAMHSNPTDVIARNRLARHLIADGQAQTGLSVLEGMEEKVRGAERWRLKGLARVLEGDGGGLGDLQKCVRMRPWDEEGWTGLAWARKALGEGVDEAE